MINHYYLPSGRIKNNVYGWNYGLFMNKTQGRGGDDCDCNLINPMVRDIEVIPINPTMSF